MVIDFQSKDISKDLKDYIFRNYVYNPVSGFIYNKYGKKIKGYKKKNGYLVISIKSNKYYYHRICWLLYYGSFPKGTIDHINFNPLDNRIVNLRDVPRTFNCGRHKDLGYRPKLNKLTGLSGIGISIFKRCNCKTKTYVFHVTFKSRKFNSKSILDAINFRMSLQKYIE